MEKIRGCWEHLSMAWHALQEARAKKSNLAIMWLDIVNMLMTLSRTNLLVCST